MRAQLGMAGLAAGQRLHGDGQRAGPVFVEAGRQLAGDGAGRKHVVVGELPIGIDLEILVADIPAADQGDGVIDHQQLVMHAEIEAPEIEQEFGGPQGGHMAAVAKRVEHAQLYLRMRFEHPELLVAGHGLAIVDQDTYPHPAVGGQQHGARQQLPRLVAPENEVLQVDGLCGRMDHLHPHQEAVHAHRQQAETGAAGMERRAGRELAAQRRLLRMGQRHRGGPWKCRAWRQRSAASAQQYRQSERDANAAPAIHTPPGLSLTCAANRRG